LAQTKVITLKTQLNAVNACVRRLSQRSLIDHFSLAGDKKVTKNQKHINFSTFLICVSNNLHYKTNTILAERKILINRQIKEILLQE